jgi:hypothetical protein
VQFRCPFDSTQLHNREWRLAHGKPGIVAAFARQAWA